MNPPNADVPLEGSPEVGALPRAAENIGGRLKCSSQLVFEVDAPPRRVLIFVFSGAPEEIRTPDPKFVDGRFATTVFWVQRLGKEDVRELKTHSNARTPIPEIAKKMKRTERALRRKAGDSRHWSRP